MEMKMTLSMPSTISSTVRVTRATRFSTDTRRVYHRSPRWSRATPLRGGAHLRHLADHPGDRERPCRERDDDERARNHHQEGHIERLRHAEGADRVHAEREDGAPVQRIVAKR